MGDQDEDYYAIYKIVLIGDSGVGKSNILSRYLKNEFLVDTKSTVGVEFGAKKITVNNVNVKAQIWDTAGQERYQSITNAYYKGSKGAILVYDITSKSTFENLDNWITKLKSNSDENITIVLVGNKVDLEESRKVTKEEAENKAQQYSNQFLI